MTKRRASAAAGADRLNIPSIGAPVEVRRHPGARRMTLRVSRTRRAVIVTLPLQCDLRSAGNFLSIHIEWVRKRLDTLPEPVPLRHGATLPLRGVPHTIVFTGSRRAPVPVTVCVATAGLPSIEVAGPRGEAPQQLMDWLRAAARTDIEKRVHGHARNLGLEPQRIAIRDQTSRWGSCSTTGTLSFSWRLVLAPPAILDYVAAHEVAHLAEMNHGPRFWRLVRRIMPRMEEARAWLQRYGIDLHRYAAA